MRESAEWGKKAIGDWIAMQAAMGVAKKDSLNPHFGSPYANLAEIFRVAKDTLMKNNFGFTQPASFMDGKINVLTRIWHISGEWIEDDLSLTPANQSPQSAGSCITYGRRYSLAAILGMETDDDDGNEASKQAKETTPPRAANPEGRKPKPNPVRQTVDDHKAAASAPPKPAAKTANIYTGDPDQMNRMVDFLKKVGIPSEYWDRIDQELKGRPTGDVAILIKQVKDEMQAAPVEGEFIQG